MPSGLLYIIAAPSGAGKTSLVRAVVEQINHLKISVSHVTRPPRSGEVEGLHYHFINEIDFQGKIKNQEFLEYAEVFGYCYGTSKAWVIEQLATGNDVILEIDWQGAQQIRQQFAQTVSIFIVPPSLTILKKRLAARQRDSEAVIGQRMEQASAEISHYHEFDYLIVNDAFAQAVADLICIIQAERLRTRRQHIYQDKLLLALLPV